MITDVYSFDYSLIRAADTCSIRSRRKDKVKYKELVCAFDIETSRLPSIDQSFMYIWQFQVDDFCTVIGRTWSEYEVFIDNLCQELEDGERLMVFVHNLSYEFQFLAGVYQFGQDDVFALDSRKVAKCIQYGKIEYRCSYILTNMSLAQFLKQQKVDAQKLDDFDYSVMRYPWTPMSDRELEYCVHDVLGLVQAIKRKMLNDGDTLASLPLTSTGYVRREAKKAMHSAPYEIKRVKELCPDIELYTMLREAFRGGDTHASRFMAGRILDDVHSMDRSSSYPDVMVNRKYPMTKFNREKPTLQMLTRRMSQGRAILARIQIDNLRLKTCRPVPYLSRSKCYVCIGQVEDNGRIMHADTICTTVTDLDLRIILDEYDGDLTVTELWVSTYGYLPKVYRELVKSYYINKTELKGVQGQEVYYDKSKALLNSLYGMMAQDPVKETIAFLHGEFITMNDPFEELLEKSNKHAFICYQWGVWVTAWARWELRRAINAAGDGFVYCDTDSVKYIGDIDLTAINDELEQRSKRNGAYAADPHGEVHYMGVWEHDADYEQFKTLGAKKYAFRYQGSDITKCTISGVNKQKGSHELTMAGGLQAFTEGYIFKDAGGLESVYNDDDYGVINIDGHELYISRNVCLRPSTYTLGITQDYAQLIYNAAPETLVQMKKGFNIMARRTKNEATETNTGKITKNLDIRVYLTSDEVYERWGIVANVNITVDGWLALTNIIVKENKKEERYIQYPSHKVGDEYKNIFFPCNKDAYKAFSDAVLAAVEKAEEDE